MPEIMERGRITEGGMRSTSRCGFNGAFEVRFKGQRLRILASTGEDWEVLRWELPAWEHVSVSLVNRCPNWPEMCFVKDLCWAPSELVIQFHPTEDQYVNYHPNCLHMWRPIKVALPIPPADAVGPR